MRRALICVLLVIVASAAPPRAHAQSPAAVRAAVARALPLIERSISTFVAQRSCVSCHHNSVAIMALRAVGLRGISLTPRVQKLVEAKTFDELRRASALDDAVQGLNLSDPTPNDTYLLLAAHAAGIVPDVVTGVHARRIARWQRDGHWTTSDFRPPHSSSLFTATATAARVVGLYMPTELAGERDAVLAGARRWLRDTPPLSTEDASFRVMGLAWAGATHAEVQAAAMNLLARQLAAGGWSQLAGGNGDAYSTGEALVALREAGVPVTDPMWRRGLAFLIAAQARDGTWRVPTRMVSPAQVSPPYFTTGFPYGKDEYLSFTGSCWAVMALVAALPETGSPPPAALPAPPGPASVPAWQRTALFGSTADLQARLDAKLDPNSATEGGTTLLMLAAHDPEKVRVLLGRGATPAMRSKAGVDALTVAATYADTSASLRLLFAAGATVQPPQGIRVRRAPIVFAAMAGAVESVRLLLAQGARASAESLSEAVTFGRTDVVRMLVAAGADATGTDNAGITLLHWATITNRPAAIPILARAGLDVNAQDDRGFTPLMYAASIDFGDTGVMQALLAAGADRRVRNADGQTAAALARLHGHRALAGVLDSPAPSPAR